MGLDGVELVMAFEDAFGVEISDADVLRMVTPGDVVDFIASRVTLTNEAACLTQRAFHVVRSSVLELTPNQRRAVGVRTPLSHLFVLMPAPLLATRLQQALALSRKPPLTALSTIQDLVEWLVLTAPLALKRGSAWTREEISAVVKGIVIEQLGISEDEYGEDKRFVEDLRVD